MSDSPEAGEIPPEGRELLDRDEGQEWFRGIHRPSVRGGLPRKATERFITLFTVKKKDEEVTNENTD